MRRPKLPPLGPIPPPFTVAQVEAAAEFLSGFDGEAEAWCHHVRDLLREREHTLGHRDGASLGIGLLRPPSPRVLVMLTLVAGVVSARVDGEAWGLIHGTDEDLRRPPPERLDPREHGA